MFVRCLLDRELRWLFVVGMFDQLEQYQQEGFQCEIRERRHCQPGHQVGAMRVSFDSELVA